MASTVESEMQDKQKSREELLLELSHYRRQAEKNSNEIRLGSLFKLSQMSHKSHNELLDFGLEEAINLTESKIGYIYYYDEGTKNFTLYSWSASVARQCSIMEKQSIYHLGKTGLWGEAVRQRKAIITNNYADPNPHKKGHPEGHVKLVRHLNLPIFENDKIVAVIGVGNKETDYVENDVVQLQLFMDGLWNIAKRMRAEEELLRNEEKFKAVADLSCDWEYWTAPNGDMIYCSPSCQQITGYSQKEFFVRGGLVQSIVHPLDANAYYDHVEYDEKKGNEQRELTYRIVTKDGKEKWIGHVCRPIFSKDNEYLGRRVSNRDITDRKHDEAMLLQSNEEIRFLNENILNMLRMMSHDIRSPLLTMSATLKLLQRGHYGSMDESVGNTIKDLTTRVDKILGIADDCLGKAHVVDDKLQLQKEEFDLRQEIIEPVLNELSSEIETRKITIDNKLGSIPTGSIVVHANKIWLKSVYRNLFKNAIKYGGEHVTIAYGYEDHGHYYKFCVYNNGPVIPEEKRPVLFTKFGRTGHDSTKEGIGMGLYLTKEVITQHGGEIWYEDIDNAGAFFFTLPK
jgi:PAS domain S-box-containing protein